MVSLAAPALLVALLLVVSPTEPGDAEELARRWRDHVLPTAAETAWERIPWIPTLAGGLLAADERQLPLLLWVMNGHPLGCT